MGIFPWSAAESASSRRSSRLPRITSAAQALFVGVLRVGQVQAGQGGLEVGQQLARPRIGLGGQCGRPAGQVDGAGGGLHPLQRGWADGAGSPRGRNMRNVWLRLPTYSSRSA